MVMFIVSPVAASADQTDVRDVVKAQGVALAVLLCIAPKDAAKSDVAKSARRSLVVCGSSHSSCDYHNSAAVVIAEEESGHCLFYPYCTREAAEESFNSWSWKVGRIMFDVTDGVLGAEVRQAGWAISYSTIRLAASQLPLWGKVYAQPSGPGHASVHFPSLHSAYVSYEGQQCADWRLDDGSPIPKRKYFENISYNAKMRTFTGILSFAPTSFCGDGEWEYEMAFNENFSEVVGGQIHHYTPGLTDRESPQQILHFGAEQGSEARATSYRRLRRDSQRGAALDAPPEGAVRSKREN